MARYVWGMAACALRRFDEALRYVESAVELDPLSMVAHRGVAYVWFARGDLERAREHVLQALDLSPRAPFATYLHGLIEAEAGNTDLGVTLLQRAIAQAGGTWSFVEGFIAYYQARAGQPEVAEASERRLGEIDPRTTWRWRLLRWGATTSRKPSISSSSLPAPAIRSSSISPTIHL